MRRQACCGRPRGLVWRVPAPPSHALPPPQAGHSRLQSSAAARLLDRSGPALKTSFAPARVLRCLACHVTGTLASKCMQSAVQLQHSDPSLQALMTATKGRPALQNRHLVPNLPLATPAQSSTPDPVLAKLLSQGVAFASPAPQQSVCIAPGKQKASTDTGFWTMQDMYSSNLTGF